MVTFGLTETSKARAKPRKISVRKKIWEARSKIVSHGVCFLIQISVGIFEFCTGKLRVQSKKSRKEKNQKIYRVSTIDYYEVQSMYEEEKIHNMNRNDLR